MGHNGHTKDCIERIRSILSCPDFAPNCSNARELCEILSDGEILCSILPELSSGQVSYDGALTASFYSKNSLVLAKKNLEFFLKQCRVVFGLEEHELFESDDLLTMSNPEKVVSTVLTLLNRHSSHEQGREPVAPSTATARRASLEVTNVMREICSHELALIDKLDKLLQYRNELQGLLSEWSVELVSVVFKHTEKLFAVHTEFHDKLADLADQGCEQFCLQLGALFTQMESKLEVYIDYFSHLPIAQRKMEAAFRESPELLNQLYLLDRHFRGLSFRTLYDAPIRQTTNYTQLFKRLLFVAAQDIPKAAPSVQKAIADCEALLDKANNFKRHVEQLQATKEILAQVSGLPPQLTSPVNTGLHLADDCFKVRAVRDRREEVQQCFCLLTNNKLILATRGEAATDLTFWFGIPVDSSIQVKLCEKTPSIEISLLDRDKVTLEASKSRVRDVAKWFQLIGEARARYSSTNRRSQSLSAGSTDALAAETLSQDSAVFEGVSSIQQLPPSSLPRQLNRRGSSPALPSVWSAKDFYHKGLKREKAEKMLMTRAVGTFLLRESSRGGIALSVRGSDRVEHISINEDGQNGCALGNHISWQPSLDHLIAYYRLNSLSNHFSQMNFSLGDGCVAKGRLKGHGKRLQTLKE